MYVYLLQFWGIVSTEEIVSVVLLFCLEYSNVTLLVQNSPGYLALSKGYPISLVVYGTEFCRNMYGVHNTEFRLKRY